MWAYRILLWVFTEWWEEKSGPHSSGSVSHRMKREVGEWKMMRTHCPFRNSHRRRCWWWHRARNGRFKSLRASKLTLCKRRYTELKRRSLSPPKAKKVEYGGSVNPRHVKWTRWGSVLTEVLCDLREPLSLHLPSFFCTFVLEAGKTAIQCG